MTELITGYHFDIGGRDVLEDRASIQEVTTPANLSLVVAVVADGVGGENKGERASQLAIDTFFHYLRSSSDTDVPTLLARGVQRANQAVHGIAHETGGASTTMAVAALHNGTTLYVANVGDSRVYLCRDRKLTQLTLDHTFANMMPIQGKMSREEAAANPRAESLMRAIGPRPNIPVDVGFYVNTFDPRLATERGMAGLPLKQGDAILVCSDGLVKQSRRTGQPFVTPDEIIRVLNTQEGESAARSLVSFALGRDADDNVSAAVLQTPDPARKRRAQRPSTTFIGIGLTLILAAAVIVYFVMQNQSRDRASLASAATSEAASAAETVTIAAGAIATSAGEASELAQAATGTAEAAATMTAVVAAYTPTPTATATPSPTPRPTRVPNQIGIFISGGQSIPFTLADSVTITDTFGELHINHDETAISEDAHIFAFANTQIQFEQVTADAAAEAGIRMLIYEDSDIFLDTGDYVNGVDISPIGDTRVSFFVSGSCMSVQYEQETDSVTIGCFDGSCSYRSEEREALTPLARGELLRYDVQARQATETRRIRASEGNRYRQALLASSSGREVYNRCILPLFPPTSTPTPTRTPTATPTRTPVPSSGSGGNPPPPPPPPAQPSNTPAPQPTNTTAPQPTNTTAPQPTNTTAPTNTPICMTPLPTGCQATLLHRPTNSSAGITLAWLSLGLVLGMVLMIEKPGVLRRR